MISDARGAHVSPGVYTEEKDVKLSVKSLGITSLGLCGEAVKGPAFEKIPVANWDEYTDYFGGTSPEKFKGNGLPKYEMPYIAKEYLKKSKKLNVVRVLGLSGYEAGKAWTIIAKPISGLTEAVPSGVSAHTVAVLRSKGDYNGSANAICGTDKAEMFREYVSGISISSGSDYEFTSECVVSNEQVDFFPYADKSDYGKFILHISGITSDYDCECKVSLNPKDADYIYDAFSINPLEGNKPLYIESVYDKAFDKLLVNVPDVKAAKAMFVGSTGGTQLDKDYFTFASAVSEDAVFYKKADLTGNNDKYLQKLEYSSEITSGNCTVNVNGYVYTTNSGQCYYISEVLVPQYRFEYEVKGCENVDALAASGLSNTAGNFKSYFRCAETPWYVSNVIASTTNRIDVKKLFKFYTISDGNAANYQVKVSVANVRPDAGTFDIVVRDFYDTDAAPTILEKFAGCSMVEGQSNFIAAKIGSYDGLYENKSKYITVRVADGEGIDECVPCGFLGYPIPMYKDIANCERLEMAYNNVYDGTLRPKKQYFGLNNTVLDYDVLNYKGAYAYTDGNGDATPEIITNGFHLDAIFGQNSAATVYVDGEVGFKFTAVEPITGNTNYTRLPRIVTEEYMEDTLYKDVNLRKFTAYPYGGFDGWDIHRDVRTNSDDYKNTKYKMAASNCPFDYISGKDGVGLNETLDLNLPDGAISTDYYAYLAGYMQFANPQDAKINLFATPGIDSYNNTLLVQDANEMIEDKEEGRGGDALYVYTSPMFNKGNADEMLTAEEVVDLFDDAGIDSSYACTYWPWVKIYDEDSLTYLNLPVTKDALRDMAETDNDAHPWFSAAGYKRGGVECKKACRKTKLAEEDILYAKGINPVKTFGSDGVKLWGNKTTYSEDSPLNRINVRRLMIRVKELVVDASKYMVFDQYTEDLDTQFKSLVEPILAEVKSNKGIYDYRVVTENTAENRDQHILPAKILVKPTPTLEYIPITFTVYPESVEFED